MVIFSEFEQIGLHSDLLHGVLGTGQAFVEDLDILCGYSLPVEQ